jgi:hypothetical protein
MKHTNRTEDEVFQDLEELCQSPGYVHALAFLCFESNFLRIKEEQDLNKQVIDSFSSEKLIRTEINVLIGLLIKSNISFELPEPERLSNYIEKTYILLRELHGAFYNIQNELNRFKESGFLGSPEVASQN